MSYEITGRMFMGVLEDLSSTELLVLLFLGDFTNTKTGQCNPSQTTLAAKARMTRRAVVAAMNGLEAKGYIVRQMTYRSDGGKAPCSYSVNLDKLPIRKPTHVNDVHIPCELHSHTHVNEGYIPGELDSHTHVNDVHINQEYKTKNITLKDKPPLPPKGGTVAKARKQTFDPKTMTTPDTLNADAWNEWIDYRVDKRKPVTQVSAKKQVAMLAGYSFETQQQMVDASIANGWQGLFPPKVNGNQLSAAAKTQRDIDLMQGSRLLAEAAMRQALKRKN